MTMQVLGYLYRDTAGAEIKEFVLVDLAAGSAMAATNVVGQNFEPGHRVGFGIVAQEKVADLLIGVSEMGMRFDPDQSTKGGAGAIVERVFVK